jgi:hypothetical protein
VVANANGFRVTGRLTAQRRRVALQSKSISVAAGAKQTIRLELPKQLTRMLRREGKLTLRVRSSLHDPAGSTRTVTRAIRPR